MFRTAKDQNIKLNDLHRACLYLVQAVKWNLEHEPEYEPDWPEWLRQSVERDNPAAIRLLSGLSNKYREVLRSEYIIQRVESFGRKGEPRLRFLAKYLVPDTPWFLIPQEDRDNAIKHAFRSNSEVPQDADGLTFFRPLSPVERVDELQDLIRSRKALPISYPGDVDVKLELRVHFGLFTNAEIKKGIARVGEDLVKDHRPSESKGKAKGSGHRARRSSWWYSALKDLAAMRLIHILPPEKARERFSQLYGLNIDESNFRKLRRNSISTFQHLFDTDEEPRHAKTWTERQA